MTLYIFSGIPASGKSSLSKEIARQLNVALVSKDVEQVELFERFGFQSREEKLALVREADNIIEEKILQCIASDTDVVLDKYVRDELFLQRIKRHRTVRIVYFYIYADAETICDRYNRRSKEERPLCMDVINKYPYVEGESHCWPPMTVAKVKEMLESTKRPSCVDVYEPIDSTNLTQEQVASNVMAILKKV